MSSIVKQTQNNIRCTANISPVNANDVEIQLRIRKERRKNIFQDNSLFFCTVKTLYEVTYRNYKSNELKSPRFNV